MSFGSVNATVLAAGDARPVVLIALAVILAVSLIGAFTARVLNERARRTRRWR
ncbi:MAG: hypothetical protein GX868_01895 [Actinobacteria bacterium]|nr:hypothetical protein [Actinomycetota bacterium]